jgi:hypothetical protein
VAQTKTVAKKAKSNAAARPKAGGRIPVERIQLGVRLEKRMAKVLKAVAEYFDVSLGELLEEIVLHSFEGGGANAFTDEVIPKIREIQKVYGMNYGTHDRYRFVEKGAGAASAAKV